MTDEELFVGLASRLRDAQQRISALQLPPDEKSSVLRRFHAITDASKRDLERASRRLDALLADLDARHAGS